MFRIVIHLGDIIAAVCVAILMLVLGLGYWRDRRSQRRHERRREREGWRL